MTTEDLEPLTDWLLSQDPDVTYDPRHGDDCLMTRFYRATVPGAVGSRSTAPDRWVDGDGKSHGSGLTRQVVGRIAFLRPWTYGGALQRIDELAAEREREAEFP